MISKDLTDNINSALIEEGRWRIKDGTVIALDTSDVNKPFAKKTDKMDYLADVWDDSKGKVANGYWITQVIAANVDNEAIMPLYSELYSHEADGFESENEQILKAIRLVSNHTNKRDIWTMDRGADRKILIGELGKEDLRFVIRSEGNRNV